MKSVLQKLFLIAGMSIGFVTSGATAETITGFQDFQFGMTLQQVQADHTLIVATPEEQGAWYDTEQTVNILGHDYKQSLLFNSQSVLVQVNVYRTLSGSEPNCAHQFDTVFGAIQARYGQSDTPPERNVIAGISVITSALFTAEDGSKISLSGIWITDCTVNVAYIGSPGGTGF